MAQAKMIEKPTPVAVSSGCKVGWAYYRTEAEARAANVFALKEATRKARLGYDFGYRSPGHELRLCEKGEHAGLWEIVVP
jgi:hypothetical protein